MYTQVSQHWVNTGQMEKAMEIFKRNTQLARKVKGFMSRDILVSEKEPSKVTTVTCWKAKEDLEGWAKNPNRPRAPQPTPLFSKVEIDVYRSEDVP